MKKYYLNINDIYIDIIHSDNLAYLKKLKTNSVDSICTDPPYLLNFMGKRWDNADHIPHGVTPFAAWLSGYIAGEGCFRVKPSRNNKYYACVFTLKVRADEAPVIKSLCSKIGGRYHFNKAYTSKAGITSNQSIVWVVDSKEACLSLVQYLDTIPLFAKKHRDYLLWKEALNEWANTSKGSRWHGPRNVKNIKKLHQNLKDIKKYDENLKDLEFDPFMPPMQYFHYQWAKEVFRVLKPGGYLISFAATKNYHYMACGIEDAGFEIVDMLAWVYGQGMNKVGYIKGYQELGFGGSLKPAHEPICLARKPISEKNIAENIKKWGTGALNIDGCRIQANQKDVQAAKVPQPKFNSKTGEGRNGETFDLSKGRWPANLIHNGHADVISLFPHSKSGAMKTNMKRKATNNIYGKGLSKRGVKITQQDVQASEGSAARFFYCAKANKLDRANSDHPTVKPIKLMRYLTRLITPPNGICLDIFAGTGTTGYAAYLEGFDCIMIEQSKKYVGHIKNRFRPLLRG